MDWKQTEEDLTNDVQKIASLKEWQLNWITQWFKSRIESELPPQPPEKLNEEERNEFYTTNLTADIKAVYERKT
jgi:hypothetical protein